MTVEPEPEYIPLNDEEFDQEGQQANEMAHKLVIKMEDYAMAADMDFGRLAFSLWDELTFYLVGMGWTAKELKHHANEAAKCAESIKK